MARYSTRRHDSIQYCFWLVFGDDGNLRMTRGEPDISRGERAMACTAELPLSLFSVPTLKATIGISEGVPSEFRIDVDAASDALRQAIGVDIDLRVVAPE
jgi:hypothetical protein